MMQTNDVYVCIWLHVHAYDWSYSDFTMIWYVLTAGSDLTMIGYGTQLHVLKEVAEMAQEQLQVSCEVVDLQTILPWDEETVYKVVYVTIPSQQVNIRLI